MASKQPTQKQLLGKAAEDAACDYLQSQGLHLVKRNFLCKLGEIDLIMKEGQTLIFIEVRFRKNANFGGAAASVTLNKQQKLQRAAQVYLQGLKQLPACRFDVIAMTLDPNLNLSCENWIKNAF